MGGDANHDITTDDLKSLEYLGMCIEESMRFSPTVPCMAREITEDIKAGLLNCLTV